MIQALVNQTGERHEVVESDLTELRQRLRRRQRREARQQESEGTDGLG